jgi:hypothetical protein
MKRRNSVFNNFNESKFTSDPKKKQSSVLGTRNEFAQDFYPEEKCNECEEVRKHRNNANNKENNKNSKH